MLPPPSAEYQSADVFQNAQTFAPLMVLQNPKLFLQKKDLLVLLIKNKLVQLEETLLDLS